MSDNTIIEGNRLIAEFMGAKYFEAWANEKYHHPTPHFYFENGDLIADKVKSHLEYHSSWDWIHPVYKKIGEIGLWMMTNSHDKLWLEKSKRIEYAMLHEDSPQKAATLISQLIQWFNNQKTQP